MKYEIPQMLKQGGGSIVNTASAAGLVGLPGAQAYNASKHGVVGLTRTAALEYAAKNVRVNCVCHGAIRTPMLERGMDTIRGVSSFSLLANQLADWGSPKKLRKVSSGSCPMRRRS